MLEYLLGEKLVPVRTYKIKSFTRRRFCIKELFEGDLIRKENKNLVLLRQEINEGELNALLLANYENWKSQLNLMMIKKQQ